MSYKMICHQPDLTIINNSNTHLLSFEVAPITFIVTSICKFL